MQFKPQQPTHWYEDSGEPAYGATLREAKKQSLNPSITSIIGIVRNPAFDARDLNILLKTAYKHGGVLLEEDFYEIVKKEFEEKKWAPARLGDKWHDAYERWNKGEKYVRFPCAETAKEIKKFHKELDIKPVYVEHNMAAHGYGGRLDLAADSRMGKVVIDLKSRANPRSYPEDLMQLAAQACLLGPEWTDAHLISLIVSTTEPGVIMPVFYAPLDEGLIEGESVKALVSFSFRLKVFYDVKRLEPKGWAK